VQRGGREGQTENDFRPISRPAEVDRGARSTATLTETTPAPGPPDLSGTRPSGAMIVRLTRCLTCARAATLSPTERLEQAAGEVIDSGDHYGCHRFPWAFQRIGICADWNAGRFVTTVYTDEVRRELVDAARVLVIQAAPQEMTIFNFLCQAYFKDADRALAGKVDRSELLAFSTGQLVTLLTPIALAASAKMAEKAVELGLVPTIQAGAAWVRRRFAAQGETDGKAGEADILPSTDQIAELRVAVVSVVVKAGVSPSSTEVVRLEAILDGAFDRISAGERMEPASE
jgi:hypothetical protein